MISICENSYTVHKIEDFADTAFAKAHFFVSSIVFHPVSKFGEMVTVISPWKECVLNY